MSFRDGWAAVNPEMPKQIPGTECSVEVFGKTKHSDIAERFEQKYKEACGYFLDG